MTCEKANTSISVVGDPAETTILYFVVSPISLLNSYQIRESAVGNAGVRFEFVRISKEVKTIFKSDVALFVSSGLSPTTLQALAKLTTFPEVNKALVVLVSTVNVMSRAVNCGRFVERRSSCLCKSNERYKVGRKT